MTNDLKLFCLIMDQYAKCPSVFEVPVPADAKVVYLQKAIKDEKAVELAQYDADSLILWKVS